MAKKMLNPKTWYLVAAGAAAGAAALTADGVRRLLRRRKVAAETVDIPMETVAAEAKSATRAAKSQPAKPAAESKPPAAKTEPVKAPVAEKKPAAAKDDLTEIKGIGPVFARRLTDVGITTFADLAQASPDHLREVTQATAVANPEEWIAQAREM